MKLKIGTPECVDLQGDTGGAVRTAELPTFQISHRSRAIPRSLHLSLGFSLPCNS